MRFDFLLLSCLCAHVTALTDYEEILQTLNTYALAIDGKDFARLDSVFTPNAFANYTGPLSNLTGRPAIRSGLAATVAKVDSQHLLGSIVVDLKYRNGNHSTDGGDESGEEALEGLSAETETAKRAVKGNSTTYFRAALFGKPYSPGEFITLYGYYEDDLGPGMVGNASILA